MTNAKTIGELLANVGDAVQRFLASNPSDCEVYAAALDVEAIALTLRREHSNRLATTPMRRRAEYRVCAT